MTTRITQSEDAKTKRAILKLEGTLTLADAKLVALTCAALSEQQIGSIAVDLHGLRFLSDESAQVLCELRASHGVVLEGMHLFVQQIIEMTEAQFNGERDSQS